MSTVDARQTVLAFVDALRAAGMRVDIVRMCTLFEALAVIPAHGLHAVYLCGRAALCATPEEIARYDACYAKFFFGDELALVEILPNPKAAPALPAAANMRKPGGKNNADDDRETEMGAASPTEVLRYRKISTLSSEEKTLILALIARLRGHVAMSRGFRLTSAKRGQIDVRRTVKAAQQRGGELDQLYRRLPRPRIRKRVLLLDISGSMAPFAPSLLRFAFAAYRCARRRTEVFTIGTRLTRITRCFITEDPEVAILNASRAVPDWSGGTRLGDQLKVFLDIWGQRGMARGAIVVIASDGLERGGVTVLAEQMRRLRRLTHRIIWSNPHKSTPGFEPLTLGMQAALPSIDDFVSGSSAHEFAELIRLMGTDQAPYRSPPARRFSAQIQPGDLEQCLVSS